MDECVPPSVVPADDVCLWPYSVGVLVKLTALLGSLHWPSAGVDLEVFPMLSFLFFVSFGLVRGFSLRKAVPRCKRVDRPISVSACSFWSRH